MKEKINIVAAKTHPPEYLLHKYWGRKPHNIISYFISELVPDDGIVLDPFCGSGVTLRESQKLGIDSIGVDVNPIANLISNVLINPPDIELFQKEIDKLLEYIEDLSSEVYTINGEQIRYLVHTVVTKCSCGNKVSVDQAIKKGRTYFCPSCNSTLKFNLENLIETNIASIVLENNKELITDSEYIKLQNAYSSKLVTDININNYDFDFTENRRILSFAGMKTSSLFTPRNFSILCSMAEQIDKIVDERAKRAAKLFLTASVAQCSRLIPYRNNLSTGGPSWSVPGFWVPAIHLETNPLIHLRARYKKFIKGLSILKNNNTNAKSEVIQGDANVIMDQLVSKGKLVDLVFFDPPYGDSVPYVEFSSLWNSFLKEFPDPRIDISVSDRDTKTEAWKQYHNSIDKSIKSISNVLKPEGKLLMTFNNNNINAWEAILGAIQRNKFRCEYVMYQIPAVISSKAQFSIKGSYVSDLYSIFRKDENLDITTSLEPVTKALIRCASSRDGKVGKSLIDRVTMISWMSNNISVDLLKEKENLVNSLFDNDEGLFILKHQYLIESENISDVSRKLARKILSEGPCEWSTLYERIANEIVEYGLPDPNELRSYLEEYIVINKNRCISFVNSTD